MGVASVKSPAQFSNTIRPEDYHIVHDNPSTQHHPTAGGRILKNKLNHFQLQQYQLTLQSSHQFQNYIDLYHWRQSQQNVVQTLHISQQTTRDFCSVNYFVKVYTQRIPIKMTEISDIPYPDNLYVMMSCMEGFGRLAEKMGYFDVGENMIGINKNGEVKVWVNDNLGLARPDFGFNDRYKRGMIQKIIDIVDDNTDKRTQPSSLKQFLDRNLKTNTFFQAITLVKQFSRMNRTQIPSHFQSVMDLITTPVNLKDQDFDLSQSNYSCVSFKRGDLYKLKGSEISAFERLEKSIASSNRNTYGGKKSLSVKETVGNGNGGRWRKTLGEDRSYMQVLPPSVVTQSIPVMRIVQNVNQPQGRESGYIQEVIGQAARQIYGHSLNPNSRVQQVTFSSNLNAIQMKETMNHVYLNPTPTCHSPYNSSVHIKQSLPIPPLAHQFQQSIHNPLLVNNSNQIFDHPLIKLTNSPHCSNMSYSRADRSEVQSACFENRREESPRTRILKIRRDQENVDPKQKGKNMGKMYYSPNGGHQIDPVVARDLMRLRDSN